MLKQATIEATNLLNIVHQLQESNDEHQDVLICLLEASVLQLSTVVGEISDDFHSTHSLAPRVPCGTERQD